MSLGDLVVSLSADTARFQSDFGKANQITEKWANAFIKNTQQAEKAIGQLSEVGRSSIDRLQQSFNTLNIKSGLQIDNEAARMQAAFEKIKNSGVASANEIKRANVALREQLASLEVINVMKGHVEGMNGFSLASVAAIAKIQILYSLINNVMGAIASIPGTAVDAIENYKSSIITNAALITSMQGATKNVGAAYQENKIYAEALEKVLIKMDNETAASYSQLQKMNRAFVEQGVILDINNKKAVEGYTSIAQAVAVIANTSQNPDMQYSQEIKGLMSGTMKPGNELLRMLVAIDKDIVEKIKRWKEAGTIPENIGPMLIGFAAAKGDIEALWQTTKSTMATIRDEILRGGLSQGFAEIVQMMKEVSKYAVENKEKIQAWLREGFQDAKSVAKFLWESRDALKALGEAALFAAFVGGIGKMITAVAALRTELLAIGWFAKLAGGAGAGTVLASTVAAGIGYGGYKAVSQVNENQRMGEEAAIANSIAASQSGKIWNRGPKFSAQHMADFKNAFPMDGPELLALAKNKGAASLIPDNLAGGSNIYKLKLDLEAIKKLKEGISKIEIPKVKSQEEESSDELIKLTHAQDEWEQTAIRSGKVSDELNAKLESLTAKYKNLMEETASATGAQAEQARVYIKEQLEIAKANEILADTKKGQKEFDKAEKDSGIAEYKSLMTEKKAALQANLANGLISQQVYNDKLYEFAKEESSKEIQELQNIVNEKRKLSAEALTKNLNGDISEGAALKALGEETKAQTELDKFKATSARTLLDLDQKRYDAQIKINDLKKQEDAITIAINISQARGVEDLYNQEEILRKMKDLSNYLSIEAKLKAAISQADNELTKSFLKSQFDALTEEFNTRQNSNSAIGLSNTLMDAALGKTKAQNQLLEKQVEIVKRKSLAEATTISEAMSAPFELGGMSQVFSTATGGLASANTGSDMAQAAKDAQKAAEEAQKAWETLQDNIRSLSQDLTVRQLKAQGLNDEAAVQALIFAQANEILKIQKQGINTTSLIIVQQMEMNKLLHDQQLAKLIKDTQTFFDVLKTNISNLVSSGNSLVSSLTGAAKSLRDASSALFVGNQSNLSPEEKYKLSRASLGSTVQQAMSSGDSALYAKIPALVTTFLDQSKAMFASGQGYTADVSWSKDFLDASATATEQAAAHAANVITAAQQQQITLDAIKNALTTDDTAALGRLKTQLVNDNTLYQKAVDDTNKALGDSGAIATKFTAAFSSDSPLNKANSDIIAGVNNVASVTGAIPAGLVNATSPIATNITTAAQAIATPFGSSGGFTAALNASFGASGSTPGAITAGLTGSDSVKSALLGSGSTSVASWLESVKLNSSSTADNIAGLAKALIDKNWNPTITLNPTINVTATGNTSSSTTANATATASAAPAVTLLSNARVVTSSSAPFFGAPQSLWVDHGYYEYVWSNGLKQKHDSFAKGSAYVPNDMTANIHQGEMIWDRQFSDGMRKYGIPTNGAADNRTSSPEIILLLTEQNKLLRMQVGLQQGTYQETMKSGNSLKEVANKTKLQAAV